MNESQSVTKDPICGMTVNETTALHAECEGKTFSFSATTITISTRTRLTAREFLGRGQVLLERLE